MANPTSVDASLWWDPFAPLLTELENASLSSDLPPPLAKKLKDNHAWFVDTLPLFNKPNEKSREALNSQQVKIGSQLLTVKPELKEKALQISSYLHLDEVQSYILVERSTGHKNIAVDSMVQEFLHVILLHYYIERQCLLKCTRRILMHALYAETSSKEGNIIREEALKLISDGLERKIISVLQDLLSASHPDQLDADLYTLWAEETLIEDNLVLDILFLTYYESFCTCNGEQWKRLCSFYKGILSGSYDFGRLAISTEAIQSSYHVKVQLLLILIETLDLENLLQMVHDEMPFREGTTVFSLTDVQEMDAIISSFNAFELKELGPLILTWAVFLCLIQSLPGKEENNELTEIDHVGYVRQAFEAASLNYFLDILQSDILKESDGPVAGYRSVLRTFVSAFIASYEISLQLEDGTLNLILDILCKIYRGEESLCIQFWDRDSFIDGPIRCLLCNLEGEFPVRTVELVRLLSSLCEGTWPAECVYNFLDKSAGISSMVEISREFLVDNISQIIETRLPLPVPGIEGLLIPSKTRGHILKVIGGNTALVRWEYTKSGVLVLLLHLAQELYTGSNEEILPALDLLSRMVSFNTAICFTLMDIGNLLNGQATGINEHVERNMWVVEIICTLVRNLSPNSYNAAVMSMSVNILAKMFKCSPSHLTAVVIKTNMFDVTLKTSIFDIGFNGSSSGAWLLSGKLAKMLLIDCEQNDVDCPLILSVLDFTMKLVETGLENDVVLALVVFSLQFVLVNHEYWKYKVKHVRWKVTLKVLEVMKKCIMSISYYEKLGEIIWDMLLRDSSIHSSLFRVICTTTQALEKLYVSRLIELMEIEGLECAIISVLNILYMMLSNFSKEISSSVPVFHQAVLSQTTKPIPVVAAVFSLISYFRNPAIQVSSAKVLSVLLMLADSLQPYLFGNVCFGLDDKQIADLRHSISFILLEQSVQNEDLFVAVVNLLTSAAHYQPAFLVAIFAGENMNVQLSNAGDVKQPTNEASFGPVGTKNSSLVDALLQYVEKSDDLINSNPSILLNVLYLLKALWQGAVQYTDILDQLISSGKFWKKMSSSISQISSTESPLLGTLTEEEALSWAHKYQCQSAILEIIAYDIFLQKKLLHPKSLVKQASESTEIIKSAVNTDNSKVANHRDLNDVLSTWCKSSVLGCLIKSYTFCEYDNKKISAAKVAASSLIVRVMGKLAAGDTGSLSVSLVEKIQVLSKKLSSQPAFSELLAQYSQRGYSEGMELTALILSDLYYHLQGDLEGRNIVPGPFKELSQFILESKILQTYQHKYDGGLFAFGKDVYLFDVKRIQADLGFDMWDHSEWKSSKAIAEAMLCRMQEANSMVLLASSKFSALKALITILTVYQDDSMEKETTIGRKIPEQLTLSCIDHTCQCFQDTIELLASFLGALEEILDYLSAQAELLLHLMRSVHMSLSLPVCALILKTSGSGLKVLTDIRSSTTGVIITVKLLLLLLLSALEFSYINSSLSGTTDAESVEDLAEVCNVSLGLLPILCNYIATAEHCTLSLTAMDLILRNFLTPNTWFPVIQKHLQLQQMVWKLHDKNSLASIPMLLKFFLTLARVRGSAEMLLNAGFLSSVKVLFADLSDGRPSLINEERWLSNSSEKIEKTQNIWGHGLAVIIAMVHSLGDSSSYIDIVNNVIPFFFSEKGYLISCYLNAPYFPSDDRDKKRPRAQRTQTSLTVLQETEHTLMLMCVLARQWRSWVKATKELDSSLREKSIHLLAFISRGTQRLGESPSRRAPLLCPPILKEEFDWCKKPSFVNSRNGWFALAPLCCLPKPNFSTVSVVTSALTVKDRATENNNPVSQTYFSDTIALQIYRIAFLLLKFLCLQAESAAKRAEEVGFVDLAHFPELPMPEILHGIQDQTIAIVSELCEAHKLKQVNPEIQSLCLALVQIMEMALYLELCVLQICGIRPVLGRLEDFSKEVKLLIKTTEGHAFLKESLKSLKQIISLVYPGFL